MSWTLIKGTGQWPVITMLMKEEYQTLSCNMKNASDILWKYLAKVRCPAWISASEVWFCSLFLTCDFIRSASKNLARSRKNCLPRHPRWKSQRSKSSSQLMTGAEINPSVADWYKKKSCKAKIDFPNYLTVDFCRTAEGLAPLFYYESYHYEFFGGSRYRYPLSVHQIWAWSVH